MEKLIEFDDLYIRKVLSAVLGTPFFGIMPHKVIEINKKFLVRYYRNGKQKEVILDELTTEAKVLKTLANK